MVYLKVICLKLSKIKKIGTYDSLIKNIEVLLPYRNELDHVRGTVDGDLEISAKCIVVGICTQIDTFCSTNA